MSDSTIRLKIKIEGSDGFKEVEMSAEQLADAIGKVKKEAHSLDEKLLNANQISQAFEQIGSAVRGLQSAMRDMTAAYSVQASAEARLEQMMRNTMDATDDDIQSIKDLASAQQQLGVIGDEVILSGAQELATYMQKKDSLEALIPVMNDMIAQQYGYNASAESAVSVAQMMGKVFAGETGALKRLGYTFDEAQEQILKFGTEEEKVATLTEVVGQIVDGTNAKLANTPFGRIAQFSNDLGDIKEKLGQMLAPAMNAVNSIASVTIALAGIGKGMSVIKASVLAFKSFSLAATVASAKAALLSFHSKMLAAAQRLLTAAGISAAAGTTALRIAVTALYAAMTLGLSLAIQGIITLITNLAGKTRDAAEGTEELKEANEAYKSAVGQAKAEIESEIAALKRLIDANADTTEAVKKLNDKYGEVFGNHQTATEWYDILTQKSQLYCRQLGYEAKAKSLAASIGAKIVERDAEQKRLEGMNESYTSYEYDDMGNALPGTEHQVKNREWQRQKKVVDDLNADIEAMEAEMKSAFGEAGKAADELKGSNALESSKKILSQKEYDLLKEHYDDLTKKQRGMIDKGYEALTDDEKRVLAKRYKTIVSSQNKEENKAYKAEIKAAEAAQREKENALKQQYYADNDKDAYESGMEQASIEGLERQKVIAKKYGKDTTNIEQHLIDENIQHKENEYNRKVKLIDEFTSEEKDCLKEELESKQITQEQYNLKVLESDLYNVDQRLKVAETYNQDTAEIVREQHELRLKLGEQGYSMEQKQLDDSLAKQKAELTRQLLDQKITQEQYDRLILVEMEKYYKARLNLAEAYGKAETGDTQAWLDAQLDLQKYDKSANGKKSKDTGSVSKNAGETWNGVKGVADSFRDIKDAITDTDNAWDALTRTVDGFINLFKNVTSVIDAIKNITAVTKTLTTEKKTASAQTVTSNVSETASETTKATMETAASQIVTEAIKKEKEAKEQLTLAIIGGDIAEGSSEVTNAGIAVGASQARAAAKRSEATANTASAATGAASSVASIPFVGPIMAVAAVASVIASLTGLPKFADGGIVYGPTIGLMGEYSGAKSNPEVIAPLSKLQGLIGNQGRSEVKFRIEGRELVGILNKQNNIYQRNG